ncbi:MAG: ANTAR domain-containing protein [Rhodospirillaceae bacterium]|jgi:AmiR/NasT family two-component response regulator|nr:ANTAR domain-containing protein [Rhodospirillaceae bacterium]MBT7356295.1 ANTAR domain-containing protein [Rhodospirillaceae bacterium]
MSEHKNTAPGSKSVGGSPKKFHDLSVAVITKRDDHGENLIREIQKTRAKVQHIWPIPEEIPTDFDIVFCELVDDLPSRFKGVPGSAHVTFIVVIPANGTMNQKVLENSVPHAVIHLPCIADEVLSAMIVARSHFQYERRLRQRIEKLDDNLRSMKTIERAKVIMMQTKNLNEEEAYKQLRRRAMQRRVTIGALASSIVDSQELLG